MLTRLIFALLIVHTLAVRSLCAGTITTVAGTGKPADGGDGGPAVATNVGDPFGVEIGPDDALYICEVRNHRVRRLDRKTGELTTVAGCGKIGYEGDGGPAKEAKLNEPYEVRFDKAGNMLFVEMKNHLVRRVEAKTGKISTIAGTGKAGFGGDGGPATAAQLSSPHSIALDKDDNLYIADIANHRIRKVDAKSGVITTIAGNGEKVQPAAGPAAGKPMLGPRALYIHDGTMWIALREGHSVWKMDLGNGMLVHVAGTGKKGYSGDGGSAEEAMFDGPKGIVTSADGMTVYVVDTENHAIRAINARLLTISTVAGRGPKAAGGTGDGGPATEATMNRPHGICVSREGEVFVGDTLNHRVRKF